MKDPDEVLLPRCNRVFVVLRMNEPKDRVSVTLLGSILLDPGFAVEMSGFFSQLVAHWSNLENTSPARLPASTRSPDD